MREQVRDKGRIEHILESIDNILEFTKDAGFEDFMKNKMLRFAVIKNLEIIGEASYKLTKEFRNAHPEIEWQIIVDLRHVLVHGYYQIKDEIVWKITQKDLEPLKKQIRILYENEF
ncbi:MAG: DUF86 domain-containing protein [Prevotellaceae bacterium]|jgi:uncharacterized protein with HEPN domain|nr:DUF86 domain-containing protein [Prevotellaceae bacterium]